MPRCPSVSRRHSPLLLGNALDVVLYVGSLEEPSIVIAIQEIERKLLYHRENDGKKNRYLTIMLGGLT